MAFLRSRKRRYFRRRNYRRKNYSIIKRIKKDIMKNNFPRKIKFMGLPERKVMFLQRESSLTFNNNDNGIKTLNLIPTFTSNIQTIMKTFLVNTNETNMCNFDKINVLAIYIRIQPNINMFQGGNGGNVISPVKCYYSLNNNIFLDGANGNVNTYNLELLKYKNIFTFNSNETFTFVIRAPSTMSTSDSIIHKKYTWWSLADIQCSENGYIHNLSNDMEQNEEEDDEETNENIILGATLDNSTLPIMHCGSLVFVNSSASKPNFNISISYKVSLKG